MLHSVSCCSKKSFGLADYNFSPHSNDHIDHMVSRSVVMPFERARPHETVIGSGDWYFYHDNTKDYKRRYKNPYNQQLAPQLLCLDALLSYLAKQHIKAFVVDMPLTSTNRHLLPDGFWSFTTPGCMNFARKMVSHVWICVQLPSVPKLIFVIPCI